MTDTWITTIEMACILRPALGSLAIDSGVVKALPLFVNVFIGSQAV